MHDIKIQKIIGIARSGNMFGYFNLALHLKKSLLLPLALPLVISFWLRSAFAWVDTIFASFLHDETYGAIGDASIAAIGLTLPLDFLLTALWVGTSNGVTARLAAAIGAGRGEEVEQIKKATVKIIFGLAAFALVIAWFIWSFTDRIGLDSVVAGQFKIYATVMMLGSALTSFWSILPDSIVKAHYDTRSTMWAGLCSSVTNLVLNAFFLFVLEWGIFGIAFSTVLGRIAGLLYASSRARRHEDKRRQDIKQNTPGLSSSPVRSILLIAIPSSVTFVLMGVESLAVNGILKNTSEAVSNLAAWSLFDRTTRFLIMPIIAAGVALLPLVARLQGEKRFKAIGFELLSGVKLSALYATLIVFPLVLFFGDLIAITLTDASTTQQAAIQLMHFVPIAVFVIAPFILTRATFDGLQRPRPGLAAAFLRTFLFVIPFVWYGSKYASYFGMTQIEAIAFGYLLGLSLGSLAFWLFARRKVILQ